MPSRRALRGSSLVIAYAVAALVSCSGGTEPPPVEVVPSAATSTVTVSSATVTSGSSVTITLRARDASGANLTAGGATVAFSLGAGSSDGTLGAVTDNSNGTYTATFTGTTAGSARTINATLNGAAVTTTMPTITVTPGAASTTTSVITVSNASIAVGGTSTLTLTAKDAAGNALTTGGATVTFTKGGGTSDGNIGAVTDNGNGTYTATFTATTAGTARSIGATIGGAAVTTTSPTITVTAAVVSAATSTVTVSAASVPSGATATITLQAKDAAGANITVGGATVTFGLGAGTSAGSIGAVTDNSNGTYAATFTGTTAGTARSITATVNGSAVTTAMPTITVTPGAISAGTSVVTVSSASIASGTTATITLQAKDAAGNNLTSGGATVAFGLGSGTSAGTIGSVTDNANGTYTATFTGTTAGTARAITATVNGASVSTTAPTITVTPGAISPAQSLVTVSTSTVAVGATATLTLTAKDAAGNNLTSGGATVAFTTSGGTSAGTIGATTDNNNGTYTATFTATAAGSATTIGATIGGAAVTTTLPTITVVQPAIELSTTNAILHTAVGDTTRPQLVGVVSVGGTNVTGLSASVLSYAAGPAGSACQSANWIRTPITFDVTNANPVAVLTIRATAQSLGVYTCTATVRVQSTSPALQKDFTVTINVSRAPVFQTGLQFIAKPDTMRAMGNAGDPNPQQITPLPRITITNGGRGTVTNVTAVVDSQTGTGATTPWLRNEHLSWDPAPAPGQPVKLPATLVINATAAPGYAKALIRVNGTGMSELKIPLDIIYNTAPHMVTNPRALTFNTYLSDPATQSINVVAFNQNHSVNNQTTRLINFRVNTTATPLPAWLTLSSSADTTVVKAAKRFTFTATSAAGVADVIDSTSVQIESDEVNVNDEVQDVKIVQLRIKRVVERGMVVSLENAKLYAAAGGSAITQDVSVTNGGNDELAGLSTSIAFVSGSGWLTAAFVPSTSTTPATLRLTATPGSLAKGTVVSANVTVSATGVPSRVIPVTFTIF